MHALRSSPLLLLLAALLAAPATTSAAAAAIPSSHQRAVDAFERTLQLRGGISSSHLGPKRASLHSRAQAIARSERVVEAHNRLHAAGRASFAMSLNALSDLSDREYRAFLQSRPDGVRPPNDALAHPPRSHGHVHVHHPHSKLSDTSAQAAATTTTSAGENTTVAIPKEVNWLTIENGKYVTPIKNQGTCGSCWAFSGIAVVESRYAIENKIPASPLSVEQVLSCSAPLDHIRSKFAKDMVSSSQGCDGGMPFLTFEYMSRVHPNGVTCEDTYPYVMATTAGETKCEAVSPDDVAVGWKNQTSNYVAIASHDEEALLRAVMSGPVSANLDATGDGFKYYASGIYDAKDCSSNGKEVNHAVVITGFGETDAGDKYWIIRNTWGTMWGENGYMRIARGAKAVPSLNGPCNLYLWSTYPVHLTSGGSTSTATSSKSGGATCALPKTTFESLSMAEAIGFSALQFALLFGSTVVVVGAGMAYYWVTERRLNIKEKAGAAKYSDSYKRWMLPSREQLLANLANRQTAQV